MTMADEPVVEPPPSACPQVRFAVTVRHDESLPGILARSGREHVLPKLCTILSAAGIDIYNPGAIIGLDDAFVPRLAHVLRQPEAVVRTRLAQRDGKALRFGGVAFPQGTLETRLRRIGPISLETSAHHRFAWMNRLLPCCPVTGEHLVDRCEACGEPLRWFRTWGIGTCETCRTSVGASPLPMLTGAALDDYRVMSDLMSGEEKLRHGAMMRLPEAARGHTAGTLAQTAIQLIGLLEGRDGLGGEMKQYLKLDGPAQASIVCRAGAMLRQWPHGLRDRFRAKVEEFADDHQQFFLTWRSLKRFATAKLAGEDKARIVAQGLPDIQDNIWKSFTSDGSVYSTQDAMRVLGIDSARTRRLAQVTSLIHMNKPSRYRGNRQFRADAIDDLRREKDASATFATITATTGLPTYAIEQLASCGELEHRDGEAIALAYGSRFISSRSLELLLEALETARCRSRAPKRARPLGECARLLGGGEKPWSTIIQGLSAGSMPFWGPGFAFDLHRTLILPDDLKPFLGVRIARGAGGAGFPDTYSKREAAEVLTINSPLLDASIAGLGLEFRKTGRAKIIDRKSVLEIAARVVSSAEIGEHWSMPAKRVRYDDRVRHLHRLGYGWCRRGAIRQGLIPDTI